MPTVIDFKRGQTFSFVMGVPDNVEAGTLVHWKPSAQLRKKGNITQQGLIANINTFWADETTTQDVMFYHNNTHKWPLGLAEMDILFTSTNGETLRSDTLTFNIIAGVTQ